MSLAARARFACCGFAAVFTCLSIRLVYLAVHKHEQFALTARETYAGKVAIHSRRGTITDIHGAVLASNEPLKNVIIDASMLVYEKKTGKGLEKFDLRATLASLIAKPLGMTPEAVLAGIAPKDRYIVLKKKISEQTASEIDDALAAYETARQKTQPALKGLYYEQNFERIYPAKQILSHVIGFYAFEQNEKDKALSRWRGIEGVERSMDDWLTGQDGWRTFEKDGRGRELVATRGAERAPRHGSHVRLTVDLDLQQILETELDAAFAKLKPVKASAIMMRPGTGEIMAIANRPCFDPNHPDKAKPEHRFNHAVAGVYEPGSTFKTFTIASALASNRVSIDTEIYCENGRWRYGGKWLKDHHPYGMLSVAGILEKSSNPGAAKLAVQLGDEKLHSYIRSFGFGQVTGSGLHGEVRGTVHPIHKWSNISITRIAIGHEVDVTPLQIVTATSAIANGGRLMMPQIIKEVHDDEGRILLENKPQEVRRVVTPKIAADVTEALVRVTGKKGTATRAHIPGFRVAGKTGTSQKIVDGHYVHDAHVTSFVGFVPAENPAFALIVVIDEADVPSNEDVGGLMAAPIFKLIAEQSLAHLGIQPDPILLQQDKDAVKNLAKAERR